MDKNFKNASEKALKILSIMEKATKGMVEPMSVLLVQDFGRDPFIILISCLLSLRAKDTAVYPICKQLFAQVRTAQELALYSLCDLENLLYSVGFYKKKAALLIQISRLLVESYQGQVPSTEDALLQLPGVGPKTAALVLAEGFGIPALCVDVHVHRISNRLGIVQTHTPEETERVLKALFPVEKWRDVNRLLVMWGQNICVPISPWCSKCPVRTMCGRVNVMKNR